MIFQLNGYVKAPFHVRWNCRWNINWMRKGFTNVVSSPRIVFSETSELLYSSNYVFVFKTVICVSDSSVTAELLSPIVRGCHDPTHLHAARREVGRASRAREAPVTYPVPALCSPRHWHRYPHTPMYPALPRYTPPSRYTPPYPSRCQLHYSIQ